MIASWNNNSSNMSDEEYKYEMTKAIELFEKYKLRKILWNMSNFHFIVGVELQEWQNHNLFPNMLAVGAKDHAFIMPPEMISELSVEQAVEEPNGLNFNIKHFDNEQDAVIWLKKIE